jgi:glucokinase
MINRDWQFDSFTLADELGLGKIRILNDFHAIAYALPHCDNDSRCEIGQATNQRSGNIAVLGPGSGLGMAAWIGDSDGGAAMCGEGGHITVAGRNVNEDSIIEKLRQRFGHCSAERILSGPGLIALHEAMHGISIATAEEITGNQGDTKCAETLQQFFVFLGGVAADLALITGAFGGVYIAGGIVPACIGQLVASDFRLRFEDKNRYREYMQSIPTYVITDPFPGLRGLSAYVSRKNCVGRVVRR